MRKRIILMLFAKAYCDFLDLVHPMTCPYVLIVRVLTVGNLLATLLFSDEDLGNNCEGQCEKEYIDCTLSCSDTNCLLDSGRALTECVQG